MGEYTNSPLVNLVNLSPHRTSPRSQPISKITVHQFAGNATIEAVSDFLRRTEARSSYNYGIGSDGRIVLLVDEADRCWGSSNRDNDNQAVVIGVANDTLAPKWSISSKAYEALLDLIICIIKRNPGITQMDGPGIRPGDTSPGIQYDGTPDGSLTRHNFFSNTTCPGPYLQTRFPEIVRRVNLYFDFLPDPPIHVPAVADWAKDAAIWATSYNITDGTRPSDPVTRQEVWVMLYRLHRLTHYKVNKNTFYSLLFNCVCKTQYSTLTAQRDIIRLQGFILQKVINSPRHTVKQWTCADGGRVMP